MIEFLLIVAAIFIALALLIRRSQSGRRRGQDSSGDAAYVATDSGGTGWLDSGSPAADSGSCGADTSSGGDCGGSDGGGGH